MKKAFLYITFAVFALVSCGDDKKVVQSDGNLIEFLAEEGTSTLALISNTTLKTVGNRIHVMDALSGFTGDVSWMAGDVYVDDEIVYSGTPIWDYNSGRVYPWTSDGVHTFFAWLSYDANMSLDADTFWGTTLSSNYSAEDKTLTLPALEMNTSTDQFDFLYAGTDFFIMPRTVVAPVALSMKHLFSAVSLQLRNESQDEIIVKGVSVTGLKNKKSAVLLRDSDPEFTVLSASSEFIDNSSYTTQTLANGDSYDLLARSKNTTPEFRLIWPQSDADLVPSDPDNFLTYPITVNYEYVDDVEHINHTAHLRFPEGVSLEPGVRYAFTLLFTQKHIQLTFKVNPWNYNLHEWSFDEQSISEVTELDFKENPGYDKPSKTCTIIGGNPVKGTFRVVNPSGAIWSIEPVGDVEYFTISPNQGTIDSNNPDYEFYVIPNLDPSLDRSVDKKLKFRFYVEFTDGSIHDANTEINRDGWTVILPKN